MGVLGTAVVRGSAERLYSGDRPIWDANDRWNHHKRLHIDQFGRSHFAPHLSAEARVANIGCGDEPYDWLPASSIQLDRFFVQANRYETGVVGDIERLPFSSSSFDGLVCVGPVLNYASASESLSELSRVLRPNGSLLLHFESSRSAEHLLTPRWNVDAAPYSTINAGAEDIIWLLSPNLVLRSLGRLGLRVIAKHGFHILSAVLLRLGVPQAAASRAAGLDPLARPLASLADDVILIARKPAAGVASREGTPGPSL